MVPRLVPRNLRAEGSGERTLACRSAQPPVGHNSPIDPSWTDFDTAIALWQLGELPAEKVPAAATAALVAGCETSTLGALAGAAGESNRDIESAVSRVLAERGRALPEMGHAVKLAADGSLRELVDDQAEPEALTNRLRRLAWKIDANNPVADLLVFVGLSDNWERVRAGEFERSEVLAATLDSARQLLAQGGISTP